MKHQSYKPKPAFIFDIDGVLADDRHRSHFIRQSPRNYNSYYDAMINDPPIIVGVIICQALAAQWPIYLFTGRPITHEAQTQAWLKQQLIPYDRLNMREPNDFRPNIAVKRDMLARLEGEGYWQPMAAFEDRPEVIAMYREEGVPCFAAPRNEKDWEDIYINANLYHKSL